MDYTGREDSPIDDSLWEIIDNNVIKYVRKNLTARRFINVFGPLGPGACSVEISSCEKEEQSRDGVVRTTGQVIQEIPQIYQDFVVWWREIESSSHKGYPLEFSGLYSAAQAIANKEDELIFWGNEFLGVTGICRAEGRTQIPMGNWKEGENAYIDISSAMTVMNKKGINGRYTLCISFDLYQDLQRIQPGTGLTEFERISRQMEGRVYKTIALSGRNAILICTEPQYIDIAIGVDISTVYLEQKDLNHYLRIMETVLPRIKNSDAIVTFE